MQELAGLANKEMPDDWVGSDEHNMLMTSRGGIPTDEFDDRNLWNPMPRYERVLRQVRTGILKDLPAGYIQMANSSLTSDGRKQAIETMRASERTWPLKDLTIGLIEKIDGAISPESGLGYGIDKAANIALKSLSDPLHRKAEEEFERTLDPVRSSKELFAGKAARLLGSFADIAIPFKGITQARKALSMEGLGDAASAGLRSWADEAARTAPSYIDEAIKTKTMQRRAAALYNDVNAASDAERALLEASEKDARRMADDALEYAEARAVDPFAEVPVDATLPPSLLRVARLEERGRRLAHATGDKPLRPGERHAVGSLEEALEGGTALPKGSTLTQARKELGLPEPPVVSESFATQFGSARAEQQLYEYLSNKLLKGEVISPEEAFALRGLADDVTSAKIGDAGVGSPEAILAKPVNPMSSTEEAAEAIDKVVTLYEKKVGREMPTFQKWLIGKWRTFNKNWVSMEDVMTRYPILKNDQTLRRLRLRMRGVTESVHRGIDGVGTYLRTAEGHTKVTGPALNKVMKKFGFNAEEADVFNKVFLTGERVVYDVQARVAIRQQATRVKEGLKKLQTEIRKSTDVKSTSLETRQAVNKLREELHASTRVTIDGKEIVRTGEKGFAARELKGVKSTEELLGHIDSLIKEADDVIAFNKIRVKPEVIDDHMKGLQGLRHTYGDAKFEQFIKAAEELRATAVRGTLDMFLDAGMISAKQYKAIIENNQFWAPLVKYTDDADMFADPFILQKDIAKKTRGPGGVKHQLERLRVAPGEFTQKMDPMTEIIARMGRAASWYERQSLANRVIELAMEHPDKIPLKVIKQPQAKHLPSIRYFKDGKVTYYSGDVELVKFLNGSTAAEIRSIRGAFRKIGAQQVASVFRSGVTLTTRFLLKNILRDPVQVDVLSKAGAPFFESLMRGLYITFSESNDDFMRLYQSQNLRFGTLASMEQQSKIPLATRMAQGMEARPQGAIEWVQHIGSASEELTRKGILHKALTLADPKELKKLADDIGIDVNKLPGQKKKPMLLATQEAFDKMKAQAAAGMYKDAGFGKMLKDFGSAYTERRASRLSLTDVFSDTREAPLDFANMGARAAALNSIKPFFNASVRDLEMVLRVAKEQPILFTGRMMRNIVAPSALLYLLNRDDPSYQEQPAFKRALNWYLYKKSDGSWATLPKPHMVGILGSLFAEMAVDTFTGEGGDRDWGIRELLQQLPFGESMTAFFMPRGERRDMPTRITESLAQAAPHTVGPLAEVMSNKDLFRGTEIEPMSMRDEPFHLRYRESTPMALREASALANEYLPSQFHMSPVMMHHLVRGYTGYIGEGILKLMDEPIRRAKGGDRPVPPEDIRDRIPLYAGAWSSVHAKEARGMRSQSVRDLFELRTRLGEMKDDVRAYRNRGEFEIADELRDDHPQSLAFKRIDSAARSINEKQNRIDKLLFTEESGLTEKERRAEATRLEREQTELAKDALQLYKEIYPDG
jgi:hypothetical protein